MVQPALVILSAVCQFLAHIRRTRLPVQRRPLTDSFPLHLFSDFLWQPASVSGHKAVAGHTVVLLAGLTRADEGTTGEGVEQRAVQWPRFLLAGYKQYFNTLFGRLPFVCVC